MKLSSYLKVDSNLYFRNRNTKNNFLERLESMDFAIFDFDWTLFPGLFIFDLAKKIFSEKQGFTIYKKKLAQLNRIAQIYTSGNFETAYTQFVSLLQGEDSAEFIRVSKILLARSYPYGKLTIKKLRETYNINPALVSLTSNFVTDLIFEEFCFQTVSSINYETKLESGKELFNGKFSQISSPEITKQKMLFNTDGINPKTPFICFCDSSDDLGIISNASIKVGVNPPHGLINIAEFDVILIGQKNDPWKQFYDFI